MRKWMGCLKGMQSTVSLALCGILACPGAFAETIERVDWKAFQELAAKQQVQLALPTLPQNVAEIQKLVQKTHRTIETRMANIESRPATKASFHNTIVAIDDVDRIRDGAIALLQFSADLQQNSPFQSAAQEGIKALEGQLAAWLKNESVQNAVLAVSKVEPLSTAQKKLADLQVKKFEKNKTPQELVEESKLHGLKLALAHSKNEFQRNLSFPLKSRLGSGMASTTTPDNLRVTDNLLALRREIARLSGARSWSELKLKGFSISPATVSRELNRLMRLTRADFRKYFLKKAPENTPPNTQAVDAPLPSTNSYFPLSKVLDGLLVLIAELYELRIVRLAEVPSWHPTVEFFGVTDKNTDKPLGIIALDLFSRQGKDEWFYSHDVTYARTKSGSPLELRPTAAITASFPIPKEDGPSLLEIGDVANLAHELGHAIHSLSQTSEYHGLLTQTLEMNETTELPSTYLELLVQKPAILHRLSSHYQTEKRLEISAFEEREFALRPERLWTLRSNTLLSLIDLAAHSSHPGRAKKIEQRLTKKHLFPSDPNDSLLASFHHIASDGYDSRYWIYLRSEALARRMVDKTGVTVQGQVDASYGVHVRRTLLEADSSRQTAQLLQDLLGEKPKFCAWLLESTSHQPAQR